MQSGAERKITAVIAQTENRITGTMRDWVTEFERSLFDAAREAGLPPGADEQIDEGLRRLHPAAGKAPIRSKSRLPSDSTIEGTRQGRFVVFTKTYQGQHFSGYQIGDREVGWTAEHHAERADRAGRQPHRRGLDDLPGGFPPTSPPGAVLAGACGAGRSGRVVA
jgi:hypothetical protein